MRQCGKANERTRQTFEDEADGPGRANLGENDLWTRAGQFQLIPARLPLADLKVARNAPGSHSNAASVVTQGFAPAESNSLVFAMSLEHLDGDARAIRDMFSNETNSSRCRCVPHSWRKDVAANVMGGFLGGLLIVLRNASYASYIFPLPAQQHLLQRTSASLTASHALTGSCRTHMNSPRRQSRLIS